MPNLIRVIQLIAPWILILFLPKKSFKQYLPVSLFASFLVIGMCILAIPFKWWVVKGGWKAKLLNDGSFIFGPFLVGTLWIFHFSFGNLKKYLCINLVMDSLFAFLICSMCQKLKLFKLVNFKPKHIFYSFISYSIIIYVFELLMKRSK